MHPLIVGNCKFPIRPCLFSRRQIYLHTRVYIPSLTFPIGKHGDAPRNLRKLRSRVAFTVMGGNRCLPVCSTKAPISQLALHTIACRRWRKKQINSTLPLRIEQDLSLCVAFQPLSWIEAITLPTAASCNPSRCASVFELELSWDVRDDHSRRTDASMPTTRLGHVTLVAAAGFPKPAFPLSVDSSFAGARARSFYHPKRRTP